MKLNKSKLLILIIILLTCIFIVAPQAREIDDEKWFEIVKSYYDATSRPGTETHKDWEVGVEKEFGLTLKSLRFDYKLLEADQDDRMVVVMLLFKMTAFCYNKDGDKKRVEIVRMMMAAIDKKTEKIIGVKVLDQAGPTVIHGWNGIDV